MLQHRDNWTVCPYNVLLSVAQHHLVNMQRYISLDVSCGTLPMDGYGITEHVKAVLYSIVPGWKARPHSFWVLKLDSE